MIATLTGFLHRLLDTSDGIVVALAVFMRNTLP